MTLRAPLFVENNILKYPNDILTKLSDECIHDEDYGVLIKEMQEYVGGPYCIGIAAPQLGVNKRIIVIDMGKGDKFVMHNPTIVKHSKATMINNEGCLSFPGLRVQVRRYKSVIVRGFDENWDPIQRKATKFLSTVLQHEIDHLDGITLAQSEWKRAA